VNFEPEFLLLEDILALHDSLIEAYGGAREIRDQGLLESAIAIPQASFGGQFLHNNLFEMAAAYAFHLAENQPFLDGNKRTALGAALLFLELNGTELEDPKGMLYQAMLDLASHALNKEGFAKLLRKLAGGKAQLLAF